MKAIKKTALVFITVLAMLASAFALAVNAEESGTADVTADSGQLSISFNKSSVSVGDTVTATVKVTGNEILGTHVTCNYNEEILEYVSGAYTGGAGTFNILDEAAGGGSSKSYTVTFKAIDSGECSVSGSGTISIDSTNPRDAQLNSSAGSVTVKNIVLSSNANLKSLIVSNGSISPKFSTSVTKYTVNVKYDITDCKIYVTTEDEDAKVSVRGSSSLKVGKNERVVTVTAPSGNTKEYTVVITRYEQEETSSEAVSSEPAESTEETTSLETESSDTSSEEETQEENEKLSALIDGASYIVLKDISDVTLPDGFNVTKRVFGEETVSVAVDKEENFELFYLKNTETEEIAPYTFDDNENAFKKVTVIEQMSKSYIVCDLPEAYSVPADLVAATVEIGGSLIDCYANPQAGFEDMYYLYCFNKNKFDTYRYDAESNVLQRSAEFSYSSDVIIEDIEEKQAPSLINFNKLSSDAKTVVVCLLIVIIAIIALIILLIVKLVNRVRYSDFDLEDEEDDFDVVTVNDEFELLTANEEDE